MKKRIVLLIIAGILLATTFVVATGMRHWVQMEPVPGTAAEADGAWGRARITGSHSATRGGDQIEIRMYVRNLHQWPSTVFEGWLVDEDSGYKLSLGAFTTNHRGRAVFRFQQRLVNAMIYDKLVITREVLGDVNPNPGIAVLETDLPTHEDGLPFTTMLSGDNEVPPSGSDAMGLGSFKVDTEENKLWFWIVYHGLEGEETAAHIHGPADESSNAGVLFTLPDGNPKHGFWEYDEAEEADILDGLTYVNVHTDLHAPGEIRGQIVSV